MKRIGIDLDQVLADFSEAFDTFHDEKYGTDFLKNPSDAFYLRDILNITEEEELRRVKEFYESDYFPRIKAFPDTHDNIHNLAKKYKLYLITSRPEFVEKETREWIERHYPGCFTDVILTNHYFGGTKKKSVVCLENKVDYMVEDMLHYAEDCASAGIPTFLITRPWNVNKVLKPGITRINGWDDIVEVLL